MRLNIRPSAFDVSWIINKNQCQKIKIFTTKEQYLIHKIQEFYLKKKKKDIKTYTCPALQCQIWSLTCQDDAEDIPEHILPDCPLKPLWGHQSCSEKCSSDAEGCGCDSWAGVTVGRIAAAVTHGEDAAFVPDAVGLTAGLPRHAAPARQAAVVPVAAFCLETQLPWGALGGDEFKRDFLFQEGAEVAEQIVAQQWGKEEVEPQQGDTQELQHDEPAGRRAFHWFTGKPAPDSCIRGN